MIPAEDLLSSVGIRKIGYVYRCAASASIQVRVYAPMPSQAIRSGREVGLKMVSRAHTNIQHTRVNATPQS